MTNSYGLAQIREALPGIDVVTAMEESFLAYSDGLAVVPPVGELLFEEPPGEVHIKYGYIRGEEYYVIKIASGFYENRKRNLPWAQGMMLLFRQETGEPVCILLDEGYLTDVRTAAAGAVAARCLAPKNVGRIGIFGTGVQGRMQLAKNVGRIGIFGTGVQGRMQLEYLREVVDCREVVAWGRSESSLEAYRKAVTPLGFTVQTTQDAAEVARQCNLIVTATPSKIPLLSAEAIQPGTHITAIGSDTTEKQELDPRILERADTVVADSLSQSRLRGEVYQAMRAGVLRESQVVELGAVMRRRELGRRSENQITVADLTGVAVQDIKIASAVYSALQRKTSG
jgi:ornithine cyclodeaminase